MHVGLGFAVPFQRGVPAVLANAHLDIIAKIETTVGGCGWYIGRRQGKEDFPAITKDMLTGSGARELPYNSRSRQTKIGQLGNVSSIQL